MRAKCERTGSRKDEATEEGREGGQVSKSTLESGNHSARAIDWPVATAELPHTVVAIKLPTEQIL